MFLRKAGIAILFFVICFSLTSAAQVRFGVSWDPPGDKQQVKQQLDALEQLHITHLELPSTLNKAQLELIEQYEFKIYIKPPFKYLTTSRLIRQKENIRDSLAAIIKFYDDYDSVDAIGLIETSQTNRERFKQEFLPLVEYWRQLTGKPLYTSVIFAESANILSDFVQYELYSVPDTLSSVALGNGTGMRTGQTLSYKPENITSFDQQTFRNILAFARYEKTPDILFLPFSWLAERLTEGDKIVRIIENYNKDPDAVFAVDEKDAISKQNSGLTLLFLLLIGSVAIHYRYNGTYRRLLFRYFTTHAFFVNDVAEWRIRTGAPGFIIMIQHAIAGGIILQILAEYVISPAGWDVLIYYFPPLSYIYASLPVLSLYSSMGIFGVELLAVILIYIANQSVRHINQVLLLYGWPLQLNIILCGIALTVYQANNWQGYIILIAGAYVLIWLFAYLIAVMDLNSFTTERKGLFLSCTLGAGILSIAGIIYYIVQTGSLQIVQLALSLS